MVPSCAVRVKVQHKVDARNLQVIHELVCPLLKPHSWNTFQTEMWAREPVRATGKLTSATQSALPHHTDTSAIQAQTGHVRRACAP